MDGPQRRPGLEGCASAGRGVKRILLADDDLGVREMLGRVLELERYEVITASSGREATARLMEREPDLVLLDLNLPDQDGWSTWRLMEAARPLLPVIIITARSNQLLQAERLGVDALMEKPLDLRVLLRAIEGLLAEPAAERTRRVTDPQFKTAWLNYGGDSRAERKAS